MGWLTAIGRGAEVAAVVGLTVLILRELERSEQRELHHQAVQLARQKSGKTWWGLMQLAVRRVRQKLSRWAHGTAKRKQRAAWERKLQREWMR